MDSTPTSVRNRRSLTRVNYAEDFVLDSTPDPQADGSTKLKAGVKRSANGSSTKQLSERDQAALAVKEKFAMNWQRKFSPTEKLSMAMNFNGAKLVKGCLHLIDGTKLSPEDHVYILAEPPGEPYYIGRIMEFVEKENRASESKTASSTEDTDSSGRRPRSRSISNNAADMYQVRVNWLYRQSDASRNTTDSRMLFATMHSDLCPLHGLRGKCTVKVKNAIKDLDSYTKMSSSFYFSQLYDRYINRFFDIIPTDKITNLPPKLHQMLTSNFKYAVVESGRGKDLMGAPQSCEKCLQWCSSDDSVQCAHCKHNYHMLCLDPPIYRKPSRGFGWSCAACSGALERKLEANKGLETNNIRRLSGDEDGESDTSKYAETEDENSRISKSGTGSVSPSIGRSRYEELEAAVEQAFNKEISEEQRRLQKMWPFRYLGMHSKLEDVLEFDDRIYPKAASRLGSKHQCPVPDWPGRPVIYVEPAKSSKKKNKNTLKNRTKQNANQLNEGETTEPTQEEALAALPKRERPAWIQDKPAGYIERGGESTSTLHWKNPPNHLQRTSAFLEKAKPYAEKLKIKPCSANFIDAALEAFMDCGYEEAPALQIVSTFTRKSLKEPTFTEEEKRRFEEGVKKYGSQLHPVYKEVRTKTSADVVRYYYLWKKTPAGRAVRESSESKKKKKAEVKHFHDGLVDEVADSGDDSAYDNDKAKTLKRSFVCKFCSTTAVREWRRAPGNPVADDNNPIVALCLRCARLWRRYAVAWEEPDEVMKMVQQRSGQGAKRRIEHELIEDAKAIYAERNKELERERTRKKIRVEKQQREKAAVPMPVPGRETKAKSRVKVETKQPEKTDDSGNEKEASPSAQPSDMTVARESNGESASQQKTTETASRFRQFADDEKTEWPVLPCSVCKDIDPVEKQLYCVNCGLNVHKQCYGIGESTVQADWMCDTCKNDQNPLMSTLYTCNLCPMREHTTDTATGGSMLTDGLKRTQDNNWVHVRCAVWNEETKFGDATALQPVENITKIPRQKREAVCEICGTYYGACISCAVCDKTCHVGCANKLGFATGFQLKENSDSNVTPVTIAGQKGHLKPVMICSEHPEEMSTLIRMGFVEPGTSQNVLQIYVNKYRQADKTLSGAMRRGELFTKPKNSAETEKTENLELVVSASSARDDDVLYKRGSVSCSACQKTDSAYWLKGTNENILCHHCYWMEKDPELYRSMFPGNQRISIDPEIFEKEKEPERVPQRTRVSINDILS